MPVIPGVLSRGSSEPLQPVPDTTSRSQQHPHGPASFPASVAQLPNSVKLMVSGGVAGAFSKTATAPLARLTILYQVQPMLRSSLPPNVPQALVALVKREGFTSLWKGNYATILHRLPYSSVNFYTYESATQYMEQYFPRSKKHGQVGIQDVCRRLIAGAIAGAVAGTLAYPLDLVRTRQAAQTCPASTRGVIETLRTIGVRDGITGYYRGLGATLLQLIPSLALNYTAYESLKTLLLATDPRAPPSMASSLACGSLAGFISSSLTFPLDTIRRCMQVEGHNNASGQKLRYWDLVKRIHHSRGLLGFYRGIIPEYYKVIPGVAITFCTYELMKQLMHVQRS